MDPENRKKVEGAQEKAELFKSRQVSKSSNKNLEDGTVQASAAVTTFAFSKLQVNTSEYPLRDSFILDSGSDGHICDDFSRFSNYYSK